MKILSEQKEFTFDDVLILPARSSYTISSEKQHVNIKTKISKNIELKLPIIASPMPGITEDKMAIAIGKMGGIAFIHHFQDPDRQAEQIREVKKQKLKAGASVGDGEGKLDLRLKKIVDAGVDIISLETSHADNDHTIKTIKKIKKLYPQVDLSVSLVVTGIATKRIIEAGADSVRVGIGGGSHCTTRLVTGVGRPQLSALLECSKVAKKYKIPIISDTGIRYSGDITKAIACGADAVMIGGLFSATEETPGKIILSRGKKYKMTWGMCTNTALQYDQLLSFMLKNPKLALAKLKHPKQMLKSFFNQQNKKFFEEGVQKKIPYKGSVRPIIEDLKNGLIRSMWYLGACNLQDIQAKSKIVLVTPSTNLENIPRI